MTQLFQRQVGDGADAMAVLRQLFEQQRFGHIVLSEQALFALGLDGGERAVAGFPNAQGGHRDARGFRHRTYAVKGGCGGGVGGQSRLFE